MIQSHLAVPFAIILTVSVRLVTADLSQQLCARRQTQTPRPDGVRPGVSQQGHLGYPGTGGHAQGSRGFAFGDRQSVQHGQGFEATDGAQA